MAVGKSRLTHFRKTILRRAEHDANFRRHMLAEAVNELLSGDLDAGKKILCDYINATITEKERKRYAKK
jgi:hypothetical protein